MTPAVSVILPCYNTGQDLPRALASLDAQSFRDFETIVVDDGSTEAATAARLDSLPDGIRLLRQENRGLAAARNAGMAAARGRFLLPLDCDDALAPDFLEKTVAALEAHGDAAFVFAHLKLTGDKSGVLAKNYNAFEQLFLNQLPYCLLMRADMWRSLGGYDEDMRHGYEDWEFNIRAAGRGLFGRVLPEPLFLYTVSAGGMLKSVSHRRHGQLWTTIQRRNRDLYRPRALFRLWRRWRRRPSSYPLWIYPALYLLHRLLPDPLFNRIFFLFWGLAASERTKTPPQKETPLVT